jgi:hypothetical protein
VVEVAKVAARLGSGSEGCQPLFRERGFGGGREEGCRRCAGVLSVVTSVTDAPAVLNRSEDLPKGFMIPGTDILKVKGKTMSFVNNPKVVTCVES